MYVPNSEDLVLATDSHTSGPMTSSINNFDLTPIDNSPEQLQRPRPEWTEFRAMERWNQVLPQAMALFRSTTTEPKAQKDSEHSIRNEKNWEEVYVKLEKAQVKYQNEDGWSGWVRNKRRAAANRAALASEIVGNTSGIIPDTMFSTPVFGFVQLILEAVGRGAEIRDKVSGGLENLIMMSSDVELLLATFDGDERIKRAALGLATSTLEGIERSIAFFISKGITRAGRALGMGALYEAELVQSLEMINKKAQDLLVEGEKSHQYASRIYSVETRTIVQNILNEGRTTRLEMRTGMAWLANGMKRLLDCHVEERNLRREAEERFDKRLGAMQEEMASYRANFMQHPSPGLLNAWGPYTPPRAHAQPGSESFVTRDMLLQMLNSPNAEYDTAFVLGKAADFVPKEITRTQQLIGNQAFQTWMTSSQSSKLLVNWDGKSPRKVADLSPLSLFCVSMSNMLHEHPRFIPLLWICGLHVDPEYELVGGYAMLSCLTAQLLWQHDFDQQCATAGAAVDLRRIQSGDEVELFKLLYFLILQIPDTYTLVLLIDNAIIYEREEMKATYAMSALLSLVNGALPSAVKVPFTSSPGLVDLRGQFEEGLVINVDTLPSIPWAPSQERFARDFDDALQQQ